MPESSLGPLTFAPLLKRARWGGTRLASLLGKPDHASADCSESWEVADHADDQSVVSNGPWQGWTLQRLTREHGDELLGRHAPRDRFPLLVKFLDATDRLSLQVHPDDTTARRIAPHLRGKTEAWTVLAAEPESRFWAGLVPGTSPETLAAALDNDDIDSCIPSFAAETGQCVLVPAGTVHAIGEGIVLAEIQQTSDLTFRLHDWGRFDHDGQPRPLQRSEGLAAIDFSCGAVRPTVVTTQHPRDGHRIESLVDRDEFVIVRHRVSSDTVLDNDNRFRILTVIDGRGTLEVDGTQLPLDTGKTVLLPASIHQATVAGDPDVTLLDSHLP